MNGDAAVTQPVRLYGITLNDKPEGGAGGPVVDVLLMLLPLVFLVTCTISKRLYLPTSKSVPLAATALYLFKLCYLGTPANPVSACFLQGVLLGLVPLSILFGAFFFYNVLNLTKCTEYVSTLVTTLCHSHPVAEVFLIVWGLGHLLEGASGFGTPGALLPPIAAGLGHSPFECVVALLVATSTVGPFGSSGIGIWFGLSALNWPRKELVHATFLVALTMAVMSYPIGLMSARFLLSWQDLKGCWLFVFLSITAGAVPALALAVFSFEFPALLSGMSAVVVTGLLARYGVGLRDDVPCMLARQRQQRKKKEQGQPQQVAIQIELPTTGTSGLSANRQPPAPGEDGDDAFPPAAVDRRPSFRTLRSRTVSVEASSGVAVVAASSGVDTALQLLSALGSPRCRTSQSDSRWGGIQSTSTTSGSAEVLLPATRSLSAPSLTDLAPRSEGAQQARAKAGASSNGIHLTAAPGPTSSQKQLLPAGNTGGVPKSPRATMGGKQHLRLIPWLVMLAVVAATRVPYLQKSNGQELTISLRSLCDIRISSNLVVTVADILEAGVKWSYAMLYVPSLLPFVCVGCLTLLLFRRDIPSDAHWADPFRKSWAKCKGVIMALLSALVLVALMIQGERQSPAFIIGYWLSSWLHEGYIAVSMPLGAVGAFFSGSVATSNLTFGLLQYVAAMRLGLPGPPMLMLQIVGGAAGQMVSISNILGARAVMNLQHIPEGRFVSAALPACLMYYVVGTLISLPFLLA